MTADPHAYLASLSEEQSAAALKTDNPVMIIAGAGSGKTRTLVGRLIHLITPVSEGGLGADPSSIMMVTFTNKAAREMRERILPVLEALRARNPEMQNGEPWIGTFHGLSLRILRIESRRAGLGSNFSIFDEADARALANDVAEQLDLDSFDVDEFFRDIEYAKARLYSPELLAQKHLDLEMMKAAEEPFDETANNWSLELAHFKTLGFTRVYSAYQKALADQNAVDFSDLMNRVTKLFMDNEDVRLSWMSSFRHFMVDEVQDINKAQVSWLGMLTNGARPLAVPAQSGVGADAGSALAQVNTYRLRQFPRATVAFVGDDDQSIYAFRGSEVRVMRDLQTRYPGLEIRFLKQSYRCQPSILSVANTLVANNTGRYGKEVVAADPRRARRRLEIEEHVTPADEIRRLVAEANAHISSGKSPDEFAVLVRTRDLVKAVAREMRAAGLPVTEGKASDIRKSAEVRDAMAFAGFITNPEAEVLMRRIINKPARGLGPTSMARVAANAKTKGTSLMAELRTISTDRINLPEGCEGYKPAFIRSVKNFDLLVGAIKKEIGTAANAGEAILKILDMTGYLPDLKEQAIKSAGLRGGVDKSLPPREFLAALIGANAEEKARQNNGRRAEVDMAELADMDGEDLADRAGQMSDNARRIGNLSILIEQASAVPTLAAFMQEASLEMEQKAGAAGIQVMTVHGSKGLEFDVVRLPFWIDGVFPHSRAVMEGGDEIEEERRLAYVAITRAKEDVRITRSWKLFGCPFIRQKDSYPSRFIKEIQRAPREDYRMSSMKPNDRAYQVGVVKPYVAPEPGPQKEQVYNNYGRGEVSPVTAQPAPAKAAPAPAVSAPRPNQARPAPAARGRQDPAVERFAASLEESWQAPEDPGFQGFSPMMDHDDRNYSNGDHMGDREPVYDPYPADPVQAEDDRELEFPF